MAGVKTIYAAHALSSAIGHVAGSSQSKGGHALREPARTGTPMRVSRLITRRPVLVVAPVTRTGRGGMGVLRGDVLMRDCVRRGEVGMGLFDARGDAIARGVAGVASGIRWVAWERCFRLAISPLLLWPEF
jgi:hypothetical protein